MKLNEWKRVVEKAKQNSCCRVVEPAKEEGGQCK